MRFLTLCPAKLNLGLRVIRRRGDGYHDLDTVFAQVALTDELALVPGGQAASLETQGIPLADPPASNLVLRAASAYGEATGRPVHGHWILRKRIPVAAGLGGGSSDAAAALRILQRWCGCPLSSEALCELAAGVGSDVPFFLRGGLARGLGRGEILESLRWPGALWAVLVTQERGLSTREVFDDFAGLLTTGDRLPTVVASVALSELTDGEGRLLENDLMKPALRRMPHLRRPLESLRGAGLAAVGLSGSGPTIYGIARDRDRVTQAARCLHQEGSRAIVTRLRRFVPPVCFARSF